VDWMLTSRPQARRQARHGSGCPIGTADARPTQSRVRNGCRRGQACPQRGQAGDSSGIHAEGARHLVEGGST
jgi:hypothetical protein